MNRDACLRAFVSRDRRFAGRFYVGVKTTGIYCRPGCPARLPRPSNVHFFPCAAAAEDAGFRACLRCRPETAPGTPAWLGTSAVVSRALKQIEEGEADGLSMQALAERFGVGARHLRRLFAEHVGASPAAVSRTRRLHFARRLLDETSLPMTQVALGAGFSSIRRFNEAILASFGRPPRDLRRLGRGARGNAGALTLKLPYRAPFEFDSLLSFFAARALPGVESVDGGAYRRTIAFDGGRAAGWIGVAPTPGDSSLSLTVHLAESKHLLEVAERTSRLFDLAADPREVNAALRRDPLLSPLVAARPGLRVPGAWDPFELAVRAVLGQQISVAAARTLAGRLVARYGRPLPTPGAPG
ncbi:MAG TPA: AlkA N-terminal domain-containing protein, partial [Thermoanaerobaculia bacterium]|nr:AlkA N-terminal domain-containing protein [Thermoanaerobaculia bacterium]